MDQSKDTVIRKRQKVQELAQQGYTKSQIAKKLLVGLPFVRKWFHASDVTQDRRGWVKGHKRTRTEVSPRVKPVADHQTNHSKPDPDHKDGFRDLAS